MTQNFHFLMDPLQLYATYSEYAVAPLALLSTTTDDAIFDEYSQSDVLLSPQYSLTLRLPVTHGLSALGSKLRVSEQIFCRFDNGFSRHQLLMRSIEPWTSNNLSAFVTPGVEILMREDPAKNASGATSAKANPSM